VGAAADVIGFAPRVAAALAVVIVAAWAGGKLASALRQPRVMGEMIGGISLGPSLLGAVWPELMEQLFPDEIVDGLRVVAYLGLVLFMFLVGLELDLDGLRGHGRKAVAISHASIVVPFAAGMAIAPWLHHRLDLSSPVLGFSLFMGVAMAITAFPVLARIMQERGIDRTPTGALVLACAAVDDLTAWCILAAVVAVVGAGTGVDVAVTIGGAALFGLVMVGMIRPLLARTGVSLSGGVVLAITAATATEVIGVHAIFGAFLAGAVVPRRRDLETSVVRQIEPVVMSVLLPAFFITVGLSTDVGTIDSAGMVLLAVVVILAATVGKFTGATTAARLCGSTWSEAWTIGALMNTRGLTEIIVLTVGLDLGIIDGRLFTIMVIMALVTTLMAAPALGVIERRFAATDEPSLPSDSPSGATNLDSR